MRNPGQELQVLNTIEAFYCKILGKHLGHDVPLPYTPARPPGESSHDLQRLTEWINLLDLAITAVMVRDALRDHADRTVASALLQHYVWKGSLALTDRDKTDFIVTFLYRNPDTEAWGEPGEFPQEESPPSPFELALTEIIGELPLLRPEHRQLAREFHFLAQEVEDFRRFDEIIDSGIMQRVRDIKESFGPSLYHPHVLANIASYNTHFGRRFDVLFRAAVKEIKEFAEKVLREGGSIMSRVHGDVTVKQLADVEESKMLGAEYQRAIEYFYRLARYRKAVDIRKGIVDVLGRSAAASVTPTPRPEATPVATPIANADGLEENKLQAMEDAIRSFIRAAGPRSTVPLVPLRQGTMALLPAETDAFRAEYILEKSFRADVARVLVRSASLVGQMLTELADYRSKQQSSYLWKPHADSLAYLVRVGKETTEHGRQLIALANQRGLTDKARSIALSLERLNEEVQVVAQALRAAGSTA